MAGRGATGVDMANPPVDAAAASCIDDDFGYHGLELHPPGQACRVAAPPPAQAGSSGGGRGRRVLRAIASDPGPDRYLLTLPPFLRALGEIESDAEDATPPAEPEANIEVAKATSRPGSSLGVSGPGLPADAPGEAAGTEASASDPRPAGSRGACEKLFDTPGTWSSAWSTLVMVQQASATQADVKAEGGNCAASASPPPASAHSRRVGTGVFAASAASASCAWTGGAPSAGSLQVGSFG
eukprot:CAMPEP_0179359988 /NCGR_PEP_ID=MMETSP0797-20121207/79737_1 /TAXON_ID=47934 /ORGANISM="Dinophysis acuminata, Strain DAEP01" /LENGTH=239 /DNA_ID=CAMNT_0021075313 /DNA_START=40 /DNA_END=761 /DNA_ORIENTATION=-